MDFDKRMGLATFWAFFSQTGHPGLITPRRLDAFQVGPLQLCEYNRRQRKAQWLETHIWHAKRFHMTPAADNDGSDQVTFSSRS
jgi:hypothetical protein